MASPLLNQGLNIQNIVFSLALSLIAVLASLIFSKRKHLSLVEIFKPSRFKLLMFMPTYLFLAAVFGLLVIFTNAKFSSFSDYEVLIIASYALGCVLSFSFSKALNSVSVVKQEFQAKQLNHWLRVFIIASFFIANLITSFSFLHVREYYKLFNPYRFPQDLVIIIYLLFVFLPIFSSVIVTKFFHKIGFKTNLLNTETFKKYFFKTLKTFVFVMVALFFFINIFYIKGYSFKRGFTVKKILFSKGFPERLILPPAIFAVEDLDDNVQLDLDIKDFKDFFNTFFIVFQLFHTSFLVSFFTLSWFLTISFEKNVYKFQAFMLLLFLCFNYAVFSILTNYSLTVGDVVVM